MPIKFDHVKLPKISLHRHIEGAFDANTLLQLIQKYDGNNALSKDELLKKLRCNSFSDFLIKWRWKDSYLRNYEDIQFIAESCAINLQKDHILYAELFFSPQSFIERGFEFHALVEAIEIGFAHAQYPHYKLICDITRDFGVQKGMHCVERIHHTSSKKIIGIGLGGSEHQFRAQSFKRVFQQAEEYGLHRCAHAGESAGAVSMRHSIEALNIERMGHACHLFSEEDLPQLCVDHNVALEFCPISNIATKAISNLKDHPLSRRHEFPKDLLWNINTDDPLFFSRSLSEELNVLINANLLSENELKLLYQNCVNMSWATKEQKQKLLTALSDYE